MKYKFIYCIGRAPLGLNASAVPYRMACILTYGSTIRRVYELLHDTEYKYKLVVHTISGLRTSTVPLDKTSPSEGTQVQGESQKTNGVSACSSNDVGSGTHASGKPERRL